MSMLYVERESELPTLSLEKARVEALLHIPADATALNSMSWLSQSRTKMNAADRALVCRLHLEDEILRGWRESVKK